MIPVAAATMTPLPLLALLIIVKIKDLFNKKELIPINDDEDSTDIIKTKKATVDVKESESHMKLVNGDANDNSIAWDARIM